MRELLIAKKEHLPLVALLERETFSEPWSESSLELFLENNNFCALCMEDGKLLSYCTVTSVLDEAQIVNVATDKDALRQGLARLVLSFVLEECRERGIAAVSLEVRVSNTPAIALYEGLGFSKMGTRRGFYNNPKEDAFVMIKIN